MAEVSYFHLHGDDDDDDEDDVVTLDSAPYWSNDSDTFDVFPSGSALSPSDLSRIAARRRELAQSLGVEDNPSSDTDAAFDRFFRENQINFVMDLFNDRVEEAVMAGEDYLFPPIPDFDLNLRVVSANDEMGSSNLELDLGLGFCVDRQEDDDTGFMVPDSGNEFFVSGRETVSGSGGSSTAGRPREVEIESESDSDSEDDENQDGFDLNGEDERGLETLCWDSSQLGDRRDAGEDFEWEEVDERIPGREILNMLFDTEVDEDLDASVASVIPSQGDPNRERLDLGSLEWEVLLLNMDSNPNHGGDPLDDQDEYHYTTEYDMLFGQFAENENALAGRPPASKTAVENLHSIAVTQKDVDQDNALCAVCKDEMKVGEIGKELPCSHRYHGECILPWLGIRNTCPVCRYELPTDDPEYERRRNASVGRVQ